jgi:hypothetical protein
MADGRWPMADGRWPMADGRWPMADNTIHQFATFHINSSSHFKLKVCLRPTAIDHRPSIITSNNRS